MIKNYIFVTLTGLLLSSVTMAGMARDVNNQDKPIYYQGKKTDYKSGDFKFFGDSSEFFVGGASDEYTADEWLGIYADSVTSDHWQRVIPDDGSISDGAPWCSLQFMEKKDNTVTVTGDENIRCVELLATSEKEGVIPKGMKGTLLNYGDHNEFIPQVKNITLPGEYPEASRTLLTLRTADTNAKNVDDLKIMLNEIYARYGYTFIAGGEMDEYFRKQPWYHPAFTNVDALITETEHENIKLLKSLLSPESQKKKTLYIANTTAFCKALEANNFEYIMDNTSKDLTGDTDIPIGRDSLKKSWSAFRDMMLNRPENCPRSLDGYKHSSLLYNEPTEIYYNSRFAFDESKGKYILDSAATARYCYKEGENITLNGVVTQRKYAVEEDRVHEETDLELKTVDLQCVSGADMDQAQWDRYVQLIIPSDKYPEYERMVGKKITLQGKIVIAQSMYQMTPVLLDLTDIDKPEPAEKVDVPVPLNDAQKREMLTQFQQFQSALREKNVAKVKSYLDFPVHWDMTFLPENKDNPPEEMTEALFDQYSASVIDELSPLSQITIEPQTLAIKEHRDNALSAKEQSRKYYPADDDDEGLYYYLENDQRHFVNGVCDAISSAEFSDDEMIAYVGSSANNQLPGLSELCDHSENFEFVLINNKLRLKHADFAG
ncbi:DUF4459 domain-containing protein [Lelliottia wanjuensis]|uniref:DUF4459 domain-containing protein n=1 Tax=Lelliottia wanjuensis TaxID=3050585 RepID=UPI00254F4B5E|nr:MULTISPECIES: DUF4459 domain-containing protein [unclassified Lelliottia]MDK9354799.1 DUF4459 domain-containing protein [Lelliottia sp. V106_16]MDK9372006.1 DUF4459 domain-containing protein [Lelliottia sp. V106_10]MDK9584649.1 DUF4459 domain-containing protein [Lelliottia sp. V86_10]MDK9598643.1 DUF4459 domain-containing protein [Lelliottia sp. V106_5]